MEIKDKTIRKRQVLLLIGILSAFIAAGGYLFYHNQANTIREEKYNELKAIATLKINQLVQWRNERIADARVISQSPFFIHGVEQWLNKKYDIMFKTDIEKPITLLQKEYEYESIYLVDINGEPLLSVGKVLHRFDSVTTEKILNASKSDSVVCSDFYYCKLENTVHYDIMVPLINETNTTIAMLVFRTNPYSYLYPLIQSWPTPSKTSETLLLREDGDSVLFLNDLRFHAGAALNLRISLTQKDVPAVQSVLGLEGVFEGKDYRGVEVLSDLRRMPGTPWYMVAKVDKKEIFSNLNLLSILTSLLTGILVLLCATGIMWFYHYRQRNIYKTLWQTQEEYRTTLYSIGDAVIATDNKGRVQYMNNVAEQLTGWKEHEAKNKPHEEVFRIINETTRTRLENPVQLVLKEGHIVGLVNHTLLISKDGKEIPIADSGSPIRDEKNEIIGVVLVFRDQTEERASKKALMESERKFKQVFEASNVGKSMTLPTGEINVNDAYCKMLGYSADELKNKKWQELTPADEIENIELVIGKLLKGEESSARFDKRYIKKDGSYIWADVSIVLLRDDNNEPLYFIATVVDITERKQAEEALCISEEKYRQLFENMMNGFALHEIVLNDKGRPVNYVFLEINHAFEILTGVKREAIIGRNVTEVFPGIENDSADWIGKYGEVALTGQEIRFEQYSEVLDKWYSVMAFRVRDGQFATIFEDITERKKADEALWENQARLSAHLGNTPVAVIEFDSAFRVTRWSGQAEIIFGWSADEVLGKAIGELRWVHEEDAERVAKLSAEMLGGLKGSNIHVNRNYHKDGSVLTCEWYNSVIRGSDSTTFSVLSFVLDITVRKQAEEALQESEKRFRLVLEATKEGLWEWNILTNEEFFSPQWCEIIGYAADDPALPHTYKTWEERIHPDDRQHVMATLTTHLEHKTMYNVEYRHRHKSGEYRWQNARGKAVYDEQGKPIKMIGSIVDITERKRVQDQITRMADIINSAPNAITIHNLDGRFLYSNLKNCEMHQYTLDEFLAINLHTLDVPASEAMIAKRMHLIMEKGEAIFEVEHFRKDGSILPLEVIVKQIEWDGDIALLSIGRDITERKKGEEEILRSRKSLEDLYRRLNEIREEERANISREMHDQLGQSLTALKIDLNRLQKEISTMPVAVARLNDIMEMVSNTIKDVQRISSELRPEILFDLGLVPAIEWYTDSFETRSGIKCDLQADDSRYDDDQKNLVLFRVLQEALTNVIRHANATSVSIKLWRTNAGTILSVRDNGIGISKEKADSIGSLGILGMRERARQYGGNVEISSRKNKGTTLTITIP